MCTLILQLEECLKYNKLIDTINIINEMLSRNGCSYIARLAKIKKINLDDINEKYKVYVDGEWEKDTHEIAEKYGIGDNVSTLMDKFINKILEDKEKKKAFYPITFQFVPKEKRTYAELLYHTADIVNVLFDARQMHMKFVVDIDSIPEGNEIPSEINDIMIGFQYDYIWNNLTSENNPDYENEPNKDILNESENRYVIKHFISKMEQLHGMCNIGELRTDTYYVKKLMQEVVRTGNRYLAKNKQYVRMNIKDYSSFKITPDYEMKLKHLLMQQTWENVMGNAIHSQSQCKPTLERILEVYKKQDENFANISVKKYGIFGLDELIKRDHEEFGESVMFADKPKRAIVKENVQIEDKKTVVDTDNDEYVKIIQQMKKLSEENSANFNMLREMFENMQNKVDGLSDTIIDSSADVINQIDESKNEILEQMKMFSDKIASIEDKIEVCISNKDNVDFLDLFEKKIDVIHDMATKIIPNIVIDDNVLFILAFIDKNKSEELLTKLFDDILKGKYKNEYINKMENGKLTLYQASSMLGEYIVYKNNGKIVVKCVNVNDEFMNDRVLLFFTEYGIKPKQSVYIDHDIFDEFEKMLNKARNSIVIISPWLGYNAMKQYESIIVDAARKGKKVYIRYGIGDDNGETMDSRMAISKKIAHSLEDKTSKKIITKIDDTHIKAVVIDNSECLIGSCNLLSFYSDYVTNRDKRHEMMIKSDDKVFINGVLEYCNKEE